MYVEYGVVWNVVSWYVECCIMQDAESYDVMWWCGIVMKKNVAYAMCCTIAARCQMCKKMQCVVTVVRCGGIMYMLMSNMGVVWNSCGCGMV